MSKTYRMREPDSGDVYEADPAERVRLLGKGYQELSDTEVERPTTAAPHAQPGVNPLQQHRWPPRHDTEDDED